MSDEAVRKKRAGGRAGNKIRAGSSVIDQMPWRIPVNPDRPTEPLDADGVQAIHRGAMRILRDIGIEFLNPDAVEHLRAAGCIVNGTNVRMDEDFVMEMVARAPETFTMTPRNPDSFIDLSTLETDFDRPKAIVHLGLRAVMSPMPRMVITTVSSVARSMSCKCSSVGIFWNSSASEFAPSFCRPLAVI